MGFHCSSLSSFTALSARRTVTAERAARVVQQLVVEGERHLTPELEAELGAKGYTREDLLTRTVTFLARKKAAS